MPPATDGPFPMACQETLLEALFDFDAASFGTESYSSPPYQSSQLLSQADVDLGDNFISNDTMEYLESNNAIFREFDFEEYRTSQADPLSPLSLDDSPYSISSSLTSTPEAAFSSSTNTLSLSDDFEWHDSLSGLSVSYPMQQDLDAGYSSPHLISSLGLQDGYLYVAEDGDSLHLPPETSNMPPLPTIRIDPPSSQGGSPLPLDDALGQLERAFQPTPSDAVRSTTKGNTKPLLRHHDGVFIAEDPSATAGLRRSARSLRKIGTYREIDDSDDYSSGDQSPAHYPTTSTKRKADQEYDVSDDGGELFNEASPSRSRKGSRPTARRRRKVLTLVCDIGSCRKTFGRKNDLERHKHTAAVHKEGKQSPTSLSRCDKCLKELSRPDALLRHKQDGSCGKRAGRKSGGVQKDNGPAATLAPLTPSLTP